MILALDIVNMQVSRLEALRADKDGMCFYPNDETLFYQNIEVLDGDIWDDDEALKIQVVKYIVAYAMVYRHQRNIPRYKISRQKGVTKTALEGIFKDIFWGKMPKKAEFLLNSL